MNRILYSMILGLVLVAMSGSYVMAACVPATYKMETIQGIMVASGGVGLDERACMAGLNNQYDLKLMFAKTSGAYLSGIPVMVKDANGKTVFHSVSSGPWFLAKLPAGSYKVEATYKGRTEVQNVAVGTGLHTLMFRWS